MQVSSVSQQIVRQVGVHKIPRYLYHFTTPENYERIKISGKLSPKTLDVAAGSNIFMVELSNFFRRWNFSKFWENGYGLNSNLKAQLLDKIMNSQNEVVLLRIPTSSLDTSKLRIRSQEKLFQADRELMFSTMGTCMTPSEKKLVLSNFLSDKPHLKGGDCARNSKLYKQRKESIEYLYPLEIPAQVAEKIGETDLAEALELSRNKEFPMRNIFAQMLQNTPEEAAVKTIKC